MELLVVRRTRTDISTIGDFYIDGRKKFVTLEDKDRALNIDMTLKAIANIKVKKQTAIPTGRYQVVKYNSPTRGWCLLLIGVPGFDYIEIHVGNFAVDTDGCILVGTSATKDMVQNSKKATTELYNIVFPELDKGDKVYITVV